jgi:hypothetical protein
MRVTVIGTYRALEMKLSPEHAALIAGRTRGHCLLLLGPDETAIGSSFKPLGDYGRQPLVRRLHGYDRRQPILL